MNPQEKAMLEETFELSQQNNKILRGMRRTARVSLFFNTIYYVVIVGVVVWGSYLIQPYLKKAFELYHSVNATVQSTQKNLQTVTESVQKIKK